ncbi:MAG: hypothetical protein IT371_09240 [Deltaproteobacteria bacterium]|nr:hypothetical protein [Deltaproteobacteria bacterium]
MPPSPTKAWLSIEVPGFAASAVRPEADLRVSFSFYKRVDPRARLLVADLLRYLELWDLTTGMKLALTAELLWYDEEYHEGEVSFRPKDGPFVTGHAYGLRIEPNPEYFYGPDQPTEMTHFYVGARPRVVEAMLIPVPPLEDQKRQANIVFSEPMEITTTLGAITLVDDVTGKSGPAAVRARGGAIAGVEIGPPLQGAWSPEHPLTLRVASTARSVTGHRLDGAYRGEGQPPSDFVLRFSKADARAMFGEQPCAMVAYLCISNRWWTPTGPVQPETRCVPSSSYGASNCATPEPQ